MALCHGLVPWSEPHWQMIERYLRLAAYGRQNMALLPWRERSKGRVDEATMVRFVELMDRVGLHWSGTTPPTSLPIVPSGAIC